jgi:hypothetical protein
VIVGEYDNDAVVANPTKLQAFGSMALIDELTEGDLTRYDEFYLLPHQLVMSKVWLNTERNNYRSRLSRIKMEKK